MSRRGFRRGRLESVGHRTDTSRAGTLPSRKAVFPLFSGEWVPAVERSFGKDRGGILLSEREREKIHSVSPVFGDQGVQYRPEREIC
ncbi:hypothetical protein BOX30_00990 [Leptospirillum ferriphilum]|uniref:Uncharacterized protein n=1 Tax=Leptospirillum ferriphilum TaxID=178606 RepID=A0A1V3SXN3_9BACT|nr:hypothetical protein BOX24_02245 [Leptospirillum ferriphilum]OOH84119.1 hypothetical protein BOX30_00990 [Leptospirillum ferriphilum]